VADEQNVLQIHPHYFVNTSDFDYELPASFIAQTPAEPRDSSRLLVLHRDSGAVEHRIFRELGEYLNKDDLLVLNETRVLPARIYARKETGGRVELLLLQREDDRTWQCLVGGKWLRVGTKVKVEYGPTAELIDKEDGSQRLIKFSEPIEPFLPQVGNVPLPPYIHKKLNDPERYQTVYAREPGSAAAPTAGLHFTPRLLTELQQEGVKIAYVTLHVGLDTFAPVTENDPTEHRIHTEWCQITQETAEVINQTRAAGGRVVAVGTTSVRTLESAASRRNRALSTEQISNNEILKKEYQLSPFTGPTSLFILPGYQFKVVDSMLTNFHLPKSTLLMLVSAFAGRERILKTYESAKKAGYRFYSFGDAMLIL
jgi:S-adenosylmethionine:tRNA ribosyltransferase-isomerase